MSFSPLLFCWQLIFVSLAHVRICWTASDAWGWSQTIGGILSGWTLRSAAEAAPLFSCPCLCIRFAVLWLQPAATPCCCFIHRQPLLGYFPSQLSPLFWWTNTGRIVVASCCMWRQIVQSFDRTRPQWGLSSGDLSLATCSFILFPLLCNFPGLA